jgi:hypothetical protein
VTDDDYWRERVSARFQVRAFTSGERCRHGRIQRGAPRDDRGPSYSPLGLVDSLDGGTMFFNRI